MKTGKNTIDLPDDKILNCKNSFSVLSKSISSWVSSARSRDFECLDCCLIAPLNAHGRCQRCDSNGVIRMQASGMMVRRAA